MGHGRDQSPKPYGVVAEFETPEELLKAAEACRNEGYRDLDAYSPIPVHGLTDIIDFKDDRLGWVVFMGGVSGFVGGYALEYWVSAIAYPHNAGGKPLFSMPAFFPPAYEMTILFAAFGAVMGMLALNKLPRPHQPIFNAACMARASSDRFILCIEATDPRYDEDKTMRFMESLNALSVERIRTSEGYYEGLV